MQKCSICAHARAHEINAALVAGTEPLRSVAVQFGTSKSALVRHRQHIAGVLAKAKKRADQKLGRIAEQKEMAEFKDGESLLDRLRNMNRVAQEILAEARWKGKTRDNDLALRALARLGSLVELEARILVMLAGKHLSPPAPAEGRYDWSALSEEELWVVEEAFEKAEQAALARSGNDRPPARVINASFREM
jgi:hypothetical protein